MNGINFMGNTMRDCYIGIDALFGLSYNHFTNFTSARTFFIRFFTALAGKIFDWYDLYDQLVKLVNDGNILGVVNYAGIITRMVFNFEPDTDF
jgi:hypothetical protein